jgi:DNA-directed RNA polymerase subunit L
MEIKFIEKTKNKALFDLSGVDHTFCNELKEELWNDSDVRISAYKKRHPLVSVPQFLVETTKSDVIDALVAAAKRIESTNKKFLTVLNKA